MFRQILVCFSLPIYLFFHFVTFHVPNLNVMYILLLHYDFSITVYAAYSKLGYKQFRLKYRKALVPSQGPSVLLLNSYRLYSVITNHSHSKGISGFPQDWLLAYNKVIRSLHDLRFRQHLWQQPVSADVNPITHHTLATPTVHLPDSSTWWKGAQKHFSSPPPPPSPRPCLQECVITAVANPGCLVMCLWTFLEGKRDTFCHLNVYQR